MSGGDTRTAGGRDWLPVAAACFYVVALSWTKAGGSIGFALIPLCCLFVPAARRRLGWKAMRRHALFLPTATWLAILTVYTFASPYRAEALDELRAHYPILMVLFAAAAVVQMRDASRVAASFVIAAGAAALPAVAQKFGWIDWQPRRFHGTIGIFPYAAVMVVCWSLVSWVFIRAASTWLRWTAFAIGLVTLVAMTLNGSRAIGGAMLVSAALLLICAVGARRRALIALTPLLLGIVWFLAFDPSDPLVNRIKLTTGPSADQNRMEFWKIGGMMFGESPLFGQGMGSFVPRLNEAIAAGELNSKIQPGHDFRTAHSIPIHILATQGLVGFAAFLYWGATVLAFLIRRMGEERDAMAPALLTCGVVATFGLTDTSLYDSTLCGMVALSLGIAVGVLSLRPTPGPEEPER